MEKDYQNYTRMEKREQDSKRKFVKRLIFVLIIGLIIFLGIFAAFVYDFVNGDEITFSRGKQLPISDSKLNILVLGYDSKVNGRPRSDVMMLTSFDLKEKAVGIVSIPRDTRVQIEGRSGYVKINSAFAEGGPEAAKDAVTNLLGVPVDYYVSTNFEGFSEMIDALGGIKVNIDEAMNYDDNAGNLHIHFKEGEQRLNGKQAIEYVRYREHTYADLGRIERQQRFLVDGIHQFLTPDFVLKLPQLIVKFNENIKTDMEFKDMMNLAKLVKNLKAENVKTARVPGGGQYIHNISYFVHDPEKTKELVNELIASKSYVANSKYRVAILNGNGKGGVATEVRNSIEAYGFKVDRTANANHYNYPNTIVLYPGETETDQVKTLVKLVHGKSMKEADADASTRNDLSGYDALVIIGKDFQSNSQ